MRNHRKHRKKAKSSFADAHHIELAAAVSPVFYDLYEKLKMNVAAEQLFNIGPRLGADLLYFRAAFPDDDRLLRSPFDVDRAVDARRFWIAFVPAFRHYSGNIWNFFAGRREYFLADHLGDD